MDPLTIMTTADAGLAIVHIAGELDLFTGPQLRDGLEAAVSSCAHVVADLSEVTFIDSAGLAVLIAAHKLAVTRGGSVRLAGLRAPQVRLLTITGMDALFACYPTVETAVAAGTDPS